MIAGGAEELYGDRRGGLRHPVRHLRRATTRRTRRRAPFDATRDGLVVGEGAGTLVLEELEHARARGARIHAEVLGYGTNCDGVHITKPDPATMAARRCELALADAGLPPADIDYVNAHGTATDAGDIAESQATLAVFGARMPISSLKSHIGHTLGACGAIEAWMTHRDAARGLVRADAQPRGRRPALRAARLRASASGAALDATYVDDQQLRVRRGQHLAGLPALALTAPYFQEPPR